MSFHARGEIKSLVIILVITTVHKNALAKSMLDDN